MKESRIEKEILTAAKKIFTAKGKSGTRMQEIADEAGVNKALLHYYFRSKDKLFQKVFETAITELVDSISLDVSKTESFSETLKIVINKHFEFQINNKNILQFLIWEVRNDEHLIRDYVKGIYETLGYYPFQVLMPRIEEAIKKGEIRQLNPDELIMNIMSLISFYFIILPAISSVSDLTEKQVEKLTKKRKDEIFRLIWEDIKPRELLS